MTQRTAYLNGEYLPESEAKGSMRAMGHRSISRFPCFVLGSSRRETGRFLTLLTPSGKVSSWISIFCPNSTCYP
jgi:hypothetical protein